MSQDEGRFPMVPTLTATLGVKGHRPQVGTRDCKHLLYVFAVINLVSGVGTLLGSLFGPVAVSLALPPVLVTAGPSAGDRSLRYRATFLPVAAGLVIALFAALAADLALLIPPVLLLAIAGLALVPALMAAIREISAGPLVLGPLFAFAIALSDMKIAGLDSFFWSLVLGTAISLFLEREGWHELRAKES